MDGALLQENKGPQRQQQPGRLALGIGSKGRQPKKKIGQNTGQRNPKAFGLNGQAGDQEGQATYELPANVYQDIHVFARRQIVQMPPKKHRVIPHAVAFRPTARKRIIAHIDESQRNGIGARRQKNGRQQSDPTPQAHARMKKDRQPKHRINPNYPPDIRPPKHNPPRAVLHEPHRQQ